MNFKGKVVIVTGASAGIGAATASQFAEKGAKVCLVGRNQENLNSVAKQCGDALVLVADVRMDEDAERIITETVRHFGQVDVLVNNVGIWMPSSILQEDIMNIYDEMMAINLRVPVLLTHLAVPHLIKAKGNIVNISSIGSTSVIFRENFVYNASKAALDHFTRSVALELAASGVRVNMVNPGPVVTAKMLVDAKIDIESMEKMTALERLSAPEEIAEVIMFLASDKARGITGSSYKIDNGATLKSNSFEL